MIINLNNSVISAQEVFEALGYGDNQPNEDIVANVSEIMERVNTVTRVCHYYKIIDGTLVPGRLVLDGVEFNIGKIIAAQLKNSERFAVFVATAGVGFNNYMEEIKTNGDMLGLYIADAIGSIIAERAADNVEHELGNEIFPVGDKHTNRFSPGYCGWLVSEQQKLFSLLPSKVCNVTLTDSSLMLPVKSVSGVIGIGQNVFKKEYTCSLCGHKNCYKRKIKIK